MVRENSLKKIEAVKTRYPCDIFVGTTVLMYLVIKCRLGIQDLVQNHEMPFKDSLDPCSAFDYYTVL